METTTKARVHALMHALCGATIFTVGAMAGFREIHSGPGPYPMLYAYFLLFIIGGHFFSEGLKDAMSKQMRDTLNRL